MPAFRPLPKELQKKAKNELNEDTNQVESDLQHIKDWLGKQPHLTVRQDDQFLLSYLRGSKFSLQKAREKLDYHHTIKTLLPEYFSNRDPFAADVQCVLKAGVILPLPQTNGLDGPRIIIINWNVCDPTIMPFHVIIKALCLVLDILIKEDDSAVVAGVYYIADYKHFAPGYILQLTPTVIHKTVTAIQAGYPLRIKKVDYVNLPKIFDTVIPIIKSAFPKKLNERLGLYADDHVICRDLPPSIVPQEYGGTGESLTEIKEKWKKKIESYQEWFNEDPKYCSNEKLRPDESKGDAFGVDGTFRKLNLD